MRRPMALTLATLACLGAGVAWAMPKYRLQAIEQFHYDRGNPLWQYDRRVMACTYCHVEPTGGAPWNPFGQALQAQFVADAAARSGAAQGGAGQAKKAQGDTFARVLYDRLKANGDADGDGYPDALEVFAHTLPGDPDSRPTQPLAELQKAFDAAGGVAMYAPENAGK